jgi:simple sugar transport system permease protein/ribose transport system permease protein
VKSTKHFIEIIRNNLSEYYTWLLFIGIYLVTGIFIPALFTSNTFSNVLEQGTTVCLFSFAMTFVMLIGEIDLSVISIAAFAPIMGILLWQAGTPVLVAILITLLIGCAIGFFNGIMITKLKIPSLVQTVAMWWMLTGVVLIITRGEAYTGLPGAWMWLGKTRLGPISMIVPFFVVVIVIVIILTRRTVTGRRLYLVGGNRDACSAMGIPVDRVRITAFIISGFLSALAGFLLSSRMGFVSSQFAVEWLMPAIAAPVIAGVSLKGGRGNFINVIAGAYLVQLIVMIVRTGGVSGYYTQFVQGLLVFVAILINTIRQKVTRKT